MVAATGSQHDCIFLHLLHHQQPSPLNNQLPWAAQRCMPLSGGTCGRGAAVLCSVVCALTSFFLARKARSSSSYCMAASPAAQQLLLSVEPGGHVSDELHSPTAVPCGVTQAQALVGCCSLTARCFPLACHNQTASVPHLLWPFLWRLQGLCLASLHIRSS